MEDHFSDEKGFGYRVKLKHKEEIEAHEFLFDAKKIKKDSPVLETEEGRFELPVKREFFLALFFIILLTFLGILGRIAYLQIGNFENFKLKAWQNKTRVLPIASSRGIIYDHNFTQLVFNVPSHDLIAIPQELPHRENDLKKLTQDLSAVLEEDSSVLYKYIQENILDSSPFLISSNLSQDEIIFFETNKFSGLKLEQSSSRYYQDGPSFVHILGYTGKVDRDDLSQNPNYFVTDSIGKTGVEAQYEQILRGQFGRKFFEVKADGEILTVKEGVSPKDGNGLVLHIDARLQKKLYESLVRKMREIGAKKAAAVAINPDMGGVLALVSLPSFDNNLLSAGISQEDFNKLLKSSSDPFLNRVISGIYPSGSTIKPLIASAALEEEIITPQRTIFCPGSIFVGNREFRDWKAHGVINMIKAIAESSNVYFYTIGGGYGDIDGLGIEKIAEYLGLFGWGSVLGIDLPGEVPGRLPTPDWKKEVKDERWYIGDTYNVSIGQGDIGVTPLQLTSAIAAIANGGKLYQPQVLDKVIDGDKNIIEDLAPRLIRENFIEAKNLEVVRRGMREAVISGSSIALSFLPVKTAGKTGTAQFGAKDKTHAWWTGFAPYENPEIVLTILIEGGGEGSAAAVPVAKEVLAWYFSSQ